MGCGASSPVGIDSEDPVAVARAEAAQSAALHANKERPLTLKPEWSSVNEEERRLVLAAPPAGVNDAQVAAPPLPVVPPAANLALALFASALPSPPALTLAGAGGSHRAQGAGHGTPGGTHSHHDSPHGSHRGHASPGGGSHRVHSEAGGGAASVPTADAQAQEAHGIPIFPSGLFHRLPPCVRPLSERYVLGHVLGVGGFGEVRLAVRKADGRRMAVKTISKLKFQGETERSNMINEVQLMHRVRGCENVVGIAEWGEDSSNFYMCVELCEGGELMNRIIEADHFSEKIAASYFKMMAEGIAWCHSRLVVHRDVKPENFIFENRRPDSQIKVTDFGLSCSISDPESVIEDACGSAYYIAPEVFARAYTKEADIFSLGVNLFLMLSGTVPFGAHAKTEDAIYLSIQNDPLHFGPEWTNSTPAVRELLSGLLEKDPTKRYSIKQALAHPWVSGGAASDERLDRSIVASLMAFNAKNKFKKEALKLVASTLSAAEVSHLRASFLQIDTDNSGVISYAEMAKALQVMGYKDTSRIHTIISSLDTDGDGQISYEEFLTAVVDRQLVYQQNKVWWAFCEYDLDGDGKITAEELKLALAMHNEGIVNIAAYIEEFDLNHDGAIDYEEFMRMLLPKDLRFKTVEGQRADAPS